MSPQLCSPWSVTPVLHTLPPPPPQGRLLPGTAGVRPRGDSDSRQHRELTTVPYSKVTISSINEITSNYLRIPRQQCKQLMCVRGQWVLCFRSASEDLATRGACVDEAVTVPRASAPAVTPLPLCWTHSRPSEQWEGSRIDAPSHQVRLPRLGPQSIRV